MKGNRNIGRLASLAAAVHESNTDITNVETDLDGKRIGVCGACTYELYLDRSLNIPGEYEFVVDDPQIQTYDTDSSAIQDLALGDGARLDAVMSSLYTLKEAQDSGTPIKVVGDPLFYEPLAVAIDREAPADPKPLLDEVSKIINEMHEGALVEEGPPAELVGGAKDPRTRRFLEAVL
jgi:polar amino acid transport system substrate-binding protein